MYGRVWIGGLAAAAVLAGISLGAGSAYAARISNPVAVFAGLDKITGRVTSFDVYMGETVQFGALQVTPRVCFSRDDTEAQKVDGFVEVDEITLDRKIRRIFTGWMFADSPGLNAVEHPIYDVWLTGCKLKSDVPAPADLKLPDSTPQPDPNAVKTQPTPPVGQQPGDNGVPGSQPTPDQGAVPLDQNGLPAQTPDGQPLPDGQTPLDNTVPPATQQQQPKPQFKGPIPKNPGLF